MRYYISSFFKDHISYFWYSSVSFIDCMSVASRLEAEGISCFVSSSDQCSDEVDAALIRG